MRILRDNYPRLTWDRIKNRLYLFEFQIHRLPYFLRDLIKELILRYSGKLNFTYHGKLQPRESLTFSRSERITSYSSLRRPTTHPSNRLYNTQGSNATMTKGEKTAAAAVSVDVPQYKPFYTVPFFASNWCKKD